MGLMLLLFAMNFGNTMPSLPSQHLFVATVDVTNISITELKRQTLETVKAFAHAWRKRDISTKKTTAIKLWPFYTFLKNTSQRAEANYTMNTLW